MRKRQGKVEIAISAIAELVGSQIVGPSRRFVERVCPADEIQENCLTFLSGTLSSKLLLEFEQLGAVAVLCSHEEFEKARQDARFLEEDLTLTLLPVPDPFLAMIRCIPLFYEDIPRVVGIHPSACIDPSAKIDPTASVGAFCYVGPDAVIGADAHIHPHVVIYAGAQIGDRCTIHAGAVIREECVLGPQSVIQNGAVIGADGFGYRPDPSQGLVPFPQVGITRLSARVDVGANACIDRGALGDTVIGLGTKIDNLVQVGHNTKIGSHSVLCGLVGVSGSCSIGDQVTLAGGVGVADHVHIPSKTRFGARSGVTGSVKEAGDYAGFPVVKAAEWRRQAAALRSLPEVLKEIRRALKTITVDGMEQKK